MVISLRQAIAPDRLVGRVNSVFQFLSFGSLPLGAALGGRLGRVLDLRAPFLISGVVLLATALVVARLATQRDIDAPAPPPRHPLSFDRRLGASAHHREA